MTSSPNSGDSLTACTPRNTTRDSLDFWKIRATRKQHRNSATPLLLCTFLIPLIPSPAPPTDAPVFYLLISLPSISACLFPLSSARSFSVFVPNPSSVPPPDSFPISTTARNLGVTLDSQLSLTANITITTRSCRYMLPNIRRIRRLLTQKAVQVLVLALVISSLDQGFPKWGSRPQDTEGSRDMPY
ncbi:unnamed protein product [Pleuronectes platessa]|uniref:Uncharacterized protein n=1 Tax=Pleuronectes platessa TaxID=8262 RepID=A0A9N7UPV7_PLEPL|nr:unnamed protein product [Pleuronectes platessa]